MKKIVLACFSLLLFMACQQNDKKTETDAFVINETQQVEEPHHHATGNSPLYLNDGKPWDINQEMKPYLKKSQDILKTYSNNENDTNYESMSFALKEQNNLLIKSCTMTGEAHEVLHEWLIPHLKLTTALEKAKSQKEADRIIYDLDHSFDDFNKFFK